MALILAGFIGAVLLSCGGRKGNSVAERRGADTIVKHSLKKDSNAVNQPPDTGLSADSDLNRALFDKFFTKFVRAVRRNNERELTTLIHFPLQTASVRTLTGLEYERVDTAEDLIQQDEFHKYYPNIFYPELRKQFRMVNSDDLSELEGVDGEGYYRILHRITDKGTPMFELYAQWTYTNTGLAGSYFGFVFGKVDNEYKILSYYGKFPAKF
ncbi:hypothetical protein [Chitinophaga parva]|uniref:hypothetical protein n=1 Tax=Chitinophaga parva TaxID=2169414 RepID=UPI0010573915|nr:hypothetical protein [Chitinophaga parva]